MSVHLFLGLFPVGFQDTPSLIVLSSFLPHHDVQPFEPRISRAFARLGSFEIKITIVSHSEGSELFVALVIVKMSAEKTTKILRYKRLILIK